MILEFGVMENHIEIVKEPEKISHKKVRKPAMVLDILALASPILINTKSMKIL